jgi:hypothetical protein
VRLTPRRACWRSRRLQPVARASRCLAWRSRSKTIRARVVRPLLTWTVARVQCWALPCLLAWTVPASRARLRLARTVPTLIVMARAMFAALWGWGFPARKFRILCKLVKGLPLFGGLVPVSRHHPKPAIATSDSGLQTGERKEGLVFSLCRILHRVGITVK